MSGRAGETLAQLLARTGSPWSTEMAAVANGVEPAAALRGGDPIKVAVPRPYDRRAQAP